MSLPRIGFLTLLLVGCATVGPDFDEPDVTWLENVETDLYGEAITVVGESPEDLSAWWLRFDDPVLTGLIEIARRENPGLRIAGLRVLESRALAAAAGATLYPQSQVLGADAAYLKADEGLGSNGLSTWSSSLSIGWELDFWGRFERGIESANAGFFASLANQRDAQVLLSSQVADVYWQYRTVQQRIEILKLNAERQRRSFEITQQMFEAGQQGELDLQQARTQYLGTLSSLPALEAGMAQLRNALATLLGRAPTNLPELRDAATELPTADTVAINTMPAALLQRRPDVRASLWLVAAQSAQIGVAKSEFYPAITLGASAGISGNSRDGSGSRATLAAGPGLRWNVFDWGRIENSVRIEDARLQQAIEQYRATALTAAREVSDASIAVSKTLETRALLQQTVDASERALDLAQARYREGYADFQRVLEAQRVLFTQSDRKLQNDGAHLGAVVSLYRAVAGGWTPESPDQMLDDATRQQMRERTDWGDLLDAPVDQPDRQPATTGEPLP